MQRWGDKPFYSLDYYLKQVFGEKVYKVSLNGGMTNMRLFQVSKTRAGWPYDSSGA